jgi:hypothetical protein
MVLNNSMVRLIISTISFHKGAGARPSFRPELYNAITVASGDEFSTF